MNQVDLALIILILICFVIGWKLRGVYMLIIPLAFFAGVFFANITYKIFSAVISSGVPNEAKRHLIAYSIAFLLSAGATVFIGMFLARGFDFFKLTFLDRAVGAAILITAMLMPIYFLFIFLDRKLQLNILDFHAALKNSLIFPVIQKYVRILMGISVIKHLAVIQALLK